MESCYLSMQWYDVASTILLYVLGSWKLFELMVRAGRWPENKIK